MLKKRKTMLSTVHHLYFDINIFHKQVFAKESHQDDFFLKEKQNTQKIQNYTFNLINIYVLKFI